MPSLVLGSPVHMLVSRLGAKYIVKTLKTAPGTAATGPKWAFTARATANSLKEFCMPKKLR